jgi:hypothetical protein
VRNSSSESLALERLLSERWGRAGRGAPLTTRSGRVAPVCSAICLRCRSLANFNTIQIGVDIKGWADKHYSFSVGKFLSSELTALAFPCD